ncbi:MAG: YHS domain-containing protein [Ginsengibacter sp.]
MKKILVISILLAACSSHSQKETTVDNMKDSVTAVVAPVNKFENVRFASKKDLGCGMPLSAGIEDTAHYKGKIYGFCSKECKDDFLKDPDGHIAKK